MKTLFFKLATLLWGVLFFESALASKLVNIDIGGHQYQASLEKNTRLHSQLFTQSTGETDTVSTHYLGQLLDQPDSWVRVSSIGNRWQGILFLAGEIYVLNNIHIDSQDDENINIKGARTASFETADINLSANSITDNPALSCGGSHQNKHAMSMNRNMLPSSNSIHSALSLPTQNHVAFNTLCSTSNRVNGVCLLAELEIAFDNAFQQEFGGSAQNQAASIINSVEGIYLNAFNIAFDTVTLSFPSTELFEAASIFSDGELDGDTILTDLLNKRQNGQFNFLTSNQSFFHVVTGREIRGSTAGIAFLDTACIQHFNTGVSELIRDFSNRPDLASTAIVIAHEIGHNLGADHDGDGNTCPDNAFIMAPTLSSTFIDFSSCSRTAITNAISNIPTPSQCFNFPADLSLTASNSPSNASNNSDITLTYDITTNTGFQPVSTLQVNGTIPTNQGTFTSATLAGNACSINSDGKSYQCNLSNPQALASLLIGFRGGSETTSNVTHQVAILNSPDLKEINTSNNQLTSIFPVSQSTPLPPPSSSSGGGGGGGGSFGWLLLAISLLGIFACRKHQEI